MAFAYSTASLFFRQNVFFYTLAYTFLNRYLPPWTQTVLSSGRCTVNVWGAISKDGLGPLVRIEGRFQARSYCAILEKDFIPYVLDGWLLPPPARPEPRPHRALRDGTAGRPRDQDFGVAAGRGGLESYRECVGANEKTPCWAPSHQFHFRHPLGCSKRRMGGTPSYPRTRFFTLRVYAKARSRGDCRRWTSHTLLRAVTETRWQSLHAFASFLFK